MANAIAETDQLDEKKRRLLELLKKRKRRERKEKQARETPKKIPRREPSEPLVLSFSQRRLWFIEQLEPGTSAYHVPGAVRIRGPLDVQVLQRCLDAMVERHETLRLCVRDQRGQPEPVLDSDARLSLIREDLGSVAAREREDEVRRRIDAHMHRPFDLSRAPLARTVLLHLDDEHHVFFLLLHHVISDVWSIGVFFRDVTALYDAFARNEPSPLDPLPIQYSDYALWQQKLLSGDGLERLESFWREELGDAPTVLELPTDHPRPPRQTFRGGQAYLQIDRETTEALRALATRHDASLYMALFAALNTLLFRYTGQATSLVGLPIANRNRVELEGLVGLLLDSLVVRSDLSADLSFRELLVATRERMLAAFAHQELPFDRVVEVLDVERDMSRNPLYQVMFTFQNVPGSAMDTRDLEMTRYEVLEGTARDDLELNLRETPEGLAGWFTYDVGLYDHTTAERMARQFRVVLDTVVSDPEQTLGSMPLMPAAERHLLFREWNDTTVTDPPTGGFRDLFEAQVDATPDAVAAVDALGSVTYRHLQRRVRRLAVALRRRGVGPGTLVALLDIRGIDLLTAILAVFETGGGYLPLDPHHPPHRHTQVLEQSRVGWILASGTLGVEITEVAAAWPAEDRPRVLAPEELMREAETAGTTRSESTIDAGDPVYTIFTSGSTGTPKGAMVHRAGFLNHLRSKIEELGLTSRDVVAQTASQCFDISVWQFLAALALGGRVRIFEDEIAHDPLYLLDATESEDVTVLETVPSILRLLLDEVDRRESRVPTLSALRWLVPTGEALSPELVGRWLERYPGVPMINAYGPTECSDDVTHHRIDEPLEDGMARVPIGRPIRNVSLYVVDRSLRPVPIAVSGELVVSGVAVGLGYLHSPDRTAEVFVPDPFTPDPGGRMYRTGDLVRRRADGELGFFGRLDHQIKLRGFRIELGEIEAALEDLPEIEQAIVMTRESSTGEPALVAYVIATDEPGDGEALTESLRRELQHRLPEYMVPAFFVALEEFPLTPNGKVDRKALARLAAGELEAEREFVAPRTPVEESLATIWAEVLRQDRVGVTEDFFEIGGQSLLATQVASRIREVFEIELPVRVLFQHPVLADLAVEIEVHMQRAQGLPEVPPMEPVPRDEELPLSFAQERLWFIDQMMPGLNAYNIFGAVRMRGTSNHDVLERSFGELLRRHEVLRTTFTTRDGKPHQVIVPPPERMEVPVVDLTALPADRRYDLAVVLSNEVSRRIFDLERGPLIRAHAMRIAEDDHLMAVTAHHIVYDVWSREILIRELGTLYEALWEGRPSPLPELEIQYADFAHWQRQWMEAGGVAAQLEYWVDQLEGVTSGTELPGDRSRPPVQSFSGARVYFSLSEEATVAVGRLARSHGVTLFMTVLAGFMALLHRYTKDDDVVVGSPIANRNRAEIEAMIGFFVNTQVLRTSFASEPTFAEALQRVRETALGAYSHQDLAFEELVKQLRPPRDASRQPLFQILFNFLTNYEPIVMDLPEMRLTPEVTHSGAVQFDLIVTMYEIDGVLRGSADYATDLYDRTTIERVLGNFARLLEAGAARPEHPVTELALLRPAEHHQVLREWNDTEPTWAELESVPHRIALQAERHPEAPAVRMGDRQLSYHHLVRRAGHLAARLRQRGVGSDVPVGIHLPQTPDALVALLGVLYAGGAYVALDPGYPEERLTFQLEDCGARMVVTNRRLAGRLELSPGVRELRMDDLEESGEAEEAPELTPVDGDTLAYVLYTSGSTGRPKGVGVTHRNLAASTRARRLVYGDRVHRFLLLPSLAFDSSVAGVFGTLTVGGCLVLPPAVVREEPSRLGALMDAEEVSHLLCVPSLYAVLVDQLRETSLEAVVVAGEACPAELVDRHARRLSDTPLFNEYGPTEGTVWSSVQRLEPQAEAPVPIGRPIDGVRLYVVDRTVHPVPLGVAGELCIAGAGLARGYLGRPAATAEVFGPDPFAETPGERLYRTGDVARHRPGGELVFLGRLDQQVKVRGFRIELEEIESVLRAHPAVVEAAVVAVPTSGSGEAEEVEADAAPRYQRLAAYWVPGAEPPEMEEGELREHLREYLPAYMVPATMTRLEELPRTPNEKIDRRALAEAAGEELQSKVPYVAPRNAVEETLVALWTDVLGVERVGVHDSFFDLGGHSLLTTQLASRLRDEFQVEVPLQSFFEEPTVAALAQSIELAQWARQSAEGPLETPEAEDELEEGAL